MSDSEDENSRGEVGKKFASDSPSKKKKKKRTVSGSGQRNYCFNINLIESNNDGFTEVSFRDLVAKEEQERIKNKLNGLSNGASQSGIDPYASDDDDQLKALAAKYENKYAQMPVSSKKPSKKRKAVEYDDIGDGYDEDDPFIDNSECFDEVVPQEVTTAHGGFYINTGSLEFKANDKAVLEPSSEDSGEDVKHKKSPKNLLKKKVEVKLKKAKMINTDTKTGVKKARMINTERKKPGPKPKIKDEDMGDGKKEINAVNKRLEDIKNTEPAAAPSKPAEIADLEAQLNALAKGSSDKPKAEYLGGVKITKVSAPSPVKPVIEATNSSPVPSLTTKPSMPTAKPYTQTGKPLAPTGKALTLPKSVTLTDATSDALKDKPFRCPHCPHIGYNDKRGLYQHMYRKHPKAGQKFQPEQNEDSNSSHSPANGTFEPKVPSTIKVTPVKPSLSSPAATQPKAAQPLPAKAAPAPKVAPAPKAATAPKSSPAPKVVSTAKATTPTPKVTPSPKVTSAPKAAPQPPAGPKTSAPSTPTAAEIDSAVSSISAPKLGWQNQVDFSTNLDLSISSSLNSASKAGSPLPPNPPSATLSRSPAVSTQKASRQSEATPIITKSSSPPKPTISTALDFTLTSVSQARLITQPQTKPAVDPESKAPHQRVAAAQSSPRTSAQTQPSTRPGANSQPQASMFHHDPRNILASAPSDVTSILGISPPHFEGKLQSSQQQQQQPQPSTIQQQKKPQYQQQNSNSLQLPYSSPTKPKEAVLSPDITNSLLEFAQNMNQSLQQQHKQQQPMPLLHNGQHSPRAGQAPQTSRTPTAQQQSSTILQQKAPPQNILSQQLASPVQQQQQQRQRSSPLQQPSSGHVPQMQGQRASPGHQQQERGQATLQQTSMGMPQQAGLTQQQQQIRVSPASQLQQQQHASRVSTIQHSPLSSPQRMGVTQQHGTGSSPQHPKASNHQNRGQQQQLYQQQQGLLHQQQQQEFNQQKKSSGYGISDLLNPSGALPTVVQASLGGGVVTSPATNGSNGIQSSQQQHQLLRQQQQQQQLIQQEMLQQNFFFGQ